MHFWVSHLLALSLLCWYFYPSCNAAVTTAARQYAGTAPFLHYFYFDSAFSSDYQLPFVNQHTERFSCDTALTQHRVITPSTETQSCFAWHQTVAGSTFPLVTWHHSLWEPTERPWQTGSMCFCGCGKQIVWLSFKSLISSLFELHLFISLVPTPTVRSAGLPTASECCFQIGSFSLNVLNLCERQHQLLVRFKAGFGLTNSCRTNSVESDGLATLKRLVSQTETSTFVAQTGVAGIG